MVKRINGLQERIEKLNERCRRQIEKKKLSLIKIVEEMGLAPGLDWRDVMVQGFYCGQQEARDFTLDLT